MQIESTEFPEQLLKSLRNTKLVIFAGAGVSMPHPANLPDFKELATQVAVGTGKVPNGGEPADQFLGRLKTGGTRVHQRTVDVLVNKDPKPTPLHFDLIRLYSNTEDVRIVTTNFDILFEEAAKEVFNSRPKVFEAPALPLGNRFNGIVHIHGSLNEPKEMILTHRDFGRAYLTESEGWARRFLVELFTEFTVLFVGYSHSDTIMNYLSPAIPRYDHSRRYALVGGQAVAVDQWLSLGITPITFPQACKNDYSSLEKAVSGLATYRRRGYSHWQREISEVAKGIPPTDPEAAAIVEHALGDPPLTRFFVREAERPEWVAWLDANQHLEKLFYHGELEEVDALLATWLARQFIYSHPEQLFSTLARHGGKVNPRFWKIITHHLCEGQLCQHNPQTFCRWFHFLVSTAPSDVEKSDLLKLAECTSSLGLTVSLLQVYDSMTRPRLRIRPDVVESRNDLDVYYLQKMKDECLMPNISAIAEPLLEATARRLEERHSYLNAWEKVAEDYDPDSARRPAIEPHERNWGHHVLDILIDTARDCLDWLATHRKDVAEKWSNAHIGSQVALSRRLAIHALSVRVDLVPDYKLSWLISSCKLDDPLAMHEIFRVAAQSYPKTSLEHRLLFVTAILASGSSRENASPADDAIAYHQYNWFVWLSLADPECELLQEELERLKGIHPDFEPKIQPDLKFITGRVTILHGKPSPWSVAEILREPVHEWLQQALAEEQQLDDGFYPRDQLIDKIAEAATGAPEWGLDVVHQIATLQEWGTPLVIGVLEGWRSADLNQSTLGEIVESFLQTEFRETHAKDVAGTLESLFRRNLAAVNETTLAVANRVAKEIWQNVSALQEWADSDWTTRALNHPAGQLAGFWLISIRLWISKQVHRPRALSDEYREALAELMGDHQLGGPLARCRLMSEFGYLTEVDKEWTIRNLLPLLEPHHEDFTPAWEGLLRGRLNHESVKVLQESLPRAVERIVGEASEQLSADFLNLYTDFLGWDLTSANDERLAKLLSTGTSDVNLNFALNIGVILSSLDEDQQRDWWDRWLKQYWDNRINGVPTSLSQVEVVHTIDWTIKLTAVFPEAVELATRMEPLSSAVVSVLAFADCSDLAERHPESLAKLLVHIGKLDSEPWIPTRLSALMNRLSKLDLPRDLKQAVEETKARHALN